MTTGGRTPGHGHGRGSGGRTARPRDVAFPGAAVLVSVGGEPVFERFLGGYRADQRHKSDPLDEGSYVVTDSSLLPGPHTLFDLASLTKPLACALITLRHMERGRLSVRTPLGEVLPGLPPDTQAIRVGELLTHTGGLPAVPGLERLIEPTRGSYRSGGGLPSRDEVERARRGLYAVEPDVTPGTRVLYSCTGFLLLGELLAHLGGKSLATLFAEAGSSEAGPNSGVGPGSRFTIGYLPPATERYRCAPTEDDPWRGRRIHGEVHDENAYALGGAAGNAGLFGTLHAVHEHILRMWGSVIGVERSDALLTPETARRSVSEQTASSGSGSGSGPGSGAGSRSVSERRGWGVQLPSPEWTAETGLSPRSFGHTGFTGTSFWVDPDRSLVIVALTNRVYYGREQTDQSIRRFRTALHRSAVERFYPRVPPSAR
ncbi:MAG: serine hydrolase domain-containing protein [Spirochaetia bacterium]